MIWSFYTILTIKFVQSVRASDSVTDFLVLVPKMVPVWDFVVGIICPKKLCSIYTGYSQPSVFSICMMDKNI